MSASDGDFVLPTSFGIQMTQETSASRTHLNQIRSLRETKSNHSKIMEAHKSIWFQLNEFGAENLLRLEDLGHSVLEVVSGNYFYKRWMEFKEYMDSYDEEEEAQEETKVVTVTKMDVIQRQLEDLKARMDMIHKDLERKNAQIAAFKQDIEQERTVPVSRRTSITPAELDDEGDAKAKEAAARKLVLEEMMARRRQKMMNIDE
ncbi:hypothetical protein WA538_004199, partial [Blastocystis sp. DL]